MPFVLSDETPVARKEHRCDLCSRTIEPGEKYRRTRSIGDDGPYVFKECAHCAATVRMYLDEICWDPLEGYTCEHLHEWEPTTIYGARLRAQYRRRWRRRDGALYPVPTKESVT